MIRSGRLVTVTQGRGGSSQRPRSLTTSACMGKTSLSVVHTLC